MGNNSNPKYRYSAKQKKQAHEMYYKLRRKGWRELTAYSETAKKMGCCEASVRRWVKEVNFTPADKFGHQPISMVERIETETAGAKVIEEQRSIIEAAYQAKYDELQELLSSQASANIEMANIANKLKEENKKLKQDDPYNEEKVAQIIEGLKDEISELIKALDNANAYGHRWFRRAEIYKEILNNSYSFKSIGLEIREVEE